MQKSKTIAGGKIGKRNKWTKTQQSEKKYFKN